MPMLSYTVAAGLLPRFSTLAACRHLSRVHSVTKLSVPHTDLERVSARTYHPVVGFFEDTVRALNEAEVRYVVVGGLAVILHGHARVTVDLDLVVDLDPAEVRKGIEVLLGLGLTPTVPVDALDFADPQKRSAWISEKNMLVFQMRDPSDDFRKVDLFVKEPIPFSELWDRSVVKTLQTTEVRVCSIDDLIRLKREAGRHIDLSDIEALEVILEAQGHD